MELTVRFKIDSPANNQGSIIARLNFITFPAHPAIWEPMTTLHMTQEKQIGEKKKDKISSCKLVA
jgi:hypothetical protein